MHHNTIRRVAILRRIGLVVAILGLAGATIVTLSWLRLRFPHITWGEPIPHTDLNPYGANFFLDREMQPSKIERTLDMAREAGIHWIKQQFSWEEIEPLRKGEFGWDRYDRIVDMAEQRGMQVIARLDRPPAWARPDGASETHPPADLDDYGDYVYAVVQRYRQRVRYVQIWNEPNLAAEWGQQPADPAAYVELLQVGYARAKAAEPNVVVLSAPLAINVEDVAMRGNMSDLAFLDGMYTAGARAYFDVLSANGFGLGYPPEDPPDHDKLNLRRVELQRAIMERHGDGRKAVWLNEYGWNAPPDDFPPELMVWARATEAEQAEYTVRGIAWAREHWPWLGVVNIWYFRQAGHISPDRAVYYFALVDPEFNPRPVYCRLRKATAGAQVAGPGLHQETSPAAAAPGWRMLLDPEASAGAMMAADNADDSLTFTFRGRRIGLLSDRKPANGHVVVQIDGRVPDGLAVDAQGRALVDLAADRPKTRVLTSLARHLDGGAHTLTLAPLGDGEVNVDAFVVAGPQRPWWFAAAWALCAAATVCGVLLWRRPPLGAPQPRRPG